MKLLKIFLITTLIHNINAYEDLDLKEYEVEIIIFKYSQSSTNETFDAEFIAPADKVLKFYNPSLKINSDLYKTQYKENFFNNLLKGFKLDSKKQNSYIEKADENTNVSNPKKWYRKSNNLDVLKKLNSKLEKNNEYEVLDSFKWIQNIDSKDDSKFLFHENAIKEYGIFLKLYRSRFLHVDIKSYLGVASNKTNDTTAEKIQKYESKILKSNQINKINIASNLKLNLNEPNSYIDINQDKDDLKIESTEIINIFIDEERRIFNEEIHYFDHPKFGIILSVNDV
tara:strand:- start:1621 stop:2472 length:852 start_codon:yes stop_codon:yes gene_type:complete